MEESILKDLWGKIVHSEIIGSYQQKELVFRDKSDKTLKVYIRCEKNHRRPHVHVFWKNIYEVSISISDRERLAGDMPRKNLKAIKEWGRKRVRSFNIIFHVTWKEKRSDTIDYFKQV